MGAELYKEDLIGKPQCFMEEQTTQNRVALLVNKFLCVYVCVWFSFSLFKEISAGPK